MNIKIAVLSLLAAASANAAEPQMAKVYSAHDLQKLAEGVFREVNNREREDPVEVNLLKNPSAAVGVRPNPLKQIEKALAADNPDSLEQIYRSAVSASSGQVENKTPQPVAAVLPPPQPSQMPAAEAPTVRRPNRRLDDWLQHQNREQAPLAPAP